MRWNGAVVAAAILLLSAGAVQSAEPQSSKTYAFTVSASNAPASTSSYSGSQCESNTYSGQCHGGSCTCVLMSGDFCEAERAGKPEHLKECKAFLTIDNGLATGSPGCSPLFGVGEGYGNSGLEVEFFITATYCPIEGTNFSGGWVLDLSPDYSAGSGTVSGDIAASTLTFKMTGTATSK